MNKITEVPYGFKVKKTWVNTQAYQCPKCKKISVHDEIWCVNDHAKHIANAREIKCCNRELCTNNDTI